MFLKEMVNGARNNRSMSKWYNSEFKVLGISPIDMAESRFSHEVYGTDMQKKEKKLA